MSDSKKFYDEFITYQIQSGINNRIYYLYKKTKKAGINTAHHILEIGCGIGCLSYLLSRTIKKGKLESIDISPLSVEYAKEHILNPQVSFTACDIMNFKPVNIPFDRVLMFDVLEHIPIELHPILFSNIYFWMKIGAKLLINIPNPEYIEYDQKHQPELLQETDIPVLIEVLIPSLTKAGFIIDKIETHSIWVKDDYIFLTILKKPEFSEIVLQKEFGLLKRLIIRLKRLIRNILYRYP